MFRMSLQDGMVMLNRRGYLRNHSPHVMTQVGCDKRFDIRPRTSYIRALKRKLDVEEPVLSVIPFTLALSTNPPKPTNWPP